MMLPRLIQAHRQIMAVRRARRLLRKVRRAADRGDMAGARKLMPQAEAAAAHAKALHIWGPR